MTGDQERCATPGCDSPPHAPEAHPCGKTIREGDPCEFCGDPIQRGDDGRLIPCPRCWTPIPDNLADIKALLARVDLSADIRPGSGDQ